MDYGPIGSQALILLIQQRLENLSRFCHTANHVQLTILFFVRR